MEPLLSTPQRKTVAIGLTVASVAATLIFTGWLLSLAARFFAHFSGVFIPLAVAAILALVLKPWYDWLHERLRLPPVLAVAAVYATIGVPVFLFFWFFGGMLVAQLSDLVARLPDAWAALQGALERHWPGFVTLWHEHDVGTRLTAALRQHGDLLAKGLGIMGGTAMSAGHSVARFVTASLGWIVLPVYLAMFLMTPPRATKRLDSALPFLKENTRRDVVYLAGEFVGILVSFFRGQLAIALAQALMLGAGFALIGLNYGLTIGLTFGFLNIVPYLGSTLTLVIALPLALLQPGGGLPLLLMTLGVIVAVQAIEAYLLTPRIMGRRTGLPPLAIIVAVFFWGTALDGIAGMILAIPLTAFLVVFWRLAKSKYIKAIV